MSSRTALDPNSPAEPSGLASSGHNPHKRGHGWVWLLFVAALAYGGWRYYQHSHPAGAAAAAPTATGATTGGRGGRGGGGPVPVVVATATEGSIPVYLRNIATVAPNLTVTLHSNINGQIMKVLFDEGQFVKEGDLLVQIDPRPYRVQLAQATGQQTHDQALLHDAQLDYARDQSMFNDKIIAKQQLDSQAALVTQDQGSLAADQAAIDSANLNLTYCNITAPITGRIGLRTVDPGNIVHTTDANGLATITQVQPIAVLFSLPQQTLPDVYGQLRAGKHPEVAVFAMDNTTELATGSLLTIDDSIDTTTGTYKLKAMFPNANNALFPNQAVYARLLQSTDDGLTIVPTAAVQRGPQGTYVFVLNPGRKVNMRTVNVVITEGNSSGINQGLKPGEQVVTDGADRLEDGSVVRPTAPSTNAGTESPSSTSPADASATPSTPTTNGRAGARGRSGKKANPNSH